MWLKLSTSSAGRLWLARGWNVLVFGEGKGSVYFIFSIEFVLRLDFHTMSWQTDNKWTQHHIPFPNTWLLSHILFVIIPFFLLNSLKNTCYQHLKMNLYQIIWPKGPGGGGAATPNSPLDPPMSSLQEQLSKTLFTLKVITKLTDSESEF